VIEGGIYGDMRSITDDYQNESAADIDRLKLSTVAPLLSAGVYMLEIGL
jgi:hypothetical protein